MALLKHPLRNVFPGHRGAVESGLLSGQTYAQKVLSYGPIAYWPLWEAAGPTAQCLVNPAQNGTYTGATLGQPGIGDGNTAPLFDGANDFVNIFSAALAAGFDGAEGSVAIWAKIFNVGVWTDSVWRAHVTLKTDNPNRILSGRTDVNNQTRQQFRGGGSVENVLRGGLASVEWMHWVMVWSRTELQLRTYLDGGNLQAVAGLGIWAGALAAGSTVIGANSTGASDPWYGWLAHCAVWDIPLTGPQIADLATV